MDLPRGSLTPPYHVSLDFRPVHRAWPIPLDPGTPAEPRTSVLIDSKVLPSGVRSLWGLPFFRAQAEAYEGTFHPYGNEGPRGSSFLGAGLWPVPFQKVRSACPDESLRVLGVREHLLQQMILGGGLCLRWPPRPTVGVSSPGWFREGFSPVNQPPGVRGNRKERGPPLRLAFQDGVFREGS